MFSINHRRVRFFERIKDMKAFPTHKEEGMELRDYFAAKAIPTAFAMFKHDYDRELTEGYSFGDSEDYEELAARAYLIADAMMKARDGNA